MPSHVYLFEAKSLQAYVFKTNRLKEMVGGSELIASLVNPEGEASLLNDVLSVLGAGSALRFSRRSSGAFYAFSDDAQAIDDLAALWPLALRQYAPDLEFVSARAQGDDDVSAFDAGQTLLLADANRRRSPLAAASPFVARCQRTGDPAEHWIPAKGKDKHKDKEAVDASTRAKLRFTSGNVQGLRFAESSEASDWPLLLTEDEDSEKYRDRVFPFINEKRTIAVIHADGNGLGVLVHKLFNTLSAQSPGKFAEAFLAFSSALDASMKGAARAATSKVLEPAKGDGLIYAARPIVLGGEDLTVIVRADLAMDFTEVFLEYFKQLSEVHIGKMARKYKVSFETNQLTACAGIAYVQATQPFHSAYGLAASLCDHAKEHAKHQAKVLGKDFIPSTLSFYRVTTSVIENYASAILPQHRTTTDGLRFTLEAYALEPESGLPTLAALKKLLSVVNDDRMPQSFVRELLGILGNDKLRASQRYNRWREVVARQGDAGVAFRDDFDRALGELVELQPDLPFGTPGNDALRRTPLGDINILSHAIRGAAETGENA